MDSISSRQETIHWFLAFPNNWATLFMLKSGFSTLAANSYKFLTGETLPDDCDIYGQAERYFRSYSDIKDCKKFIVWRDPIDRCISIYNEMKCNPKSHAALRPLVNMESIYHFIHDYIRCREVHTLTLTWYLEYLELDVNEFLFVDISELYHALKGVIFSLRRPDLLWMITSSAVALNSVSVISRCSVGTKLNF